MILFNPYVARKTGSVNDAVSDADMILCMDKKMNDALYTVKIML